MSLIKKRKNTLILLLLAILTGSLFVYSILPYLHRPYIIAVVNKSQSETASLNPTRLKAALSLSWDKYWEGSNPKRPLELRYYTYENDGPAQSRIEEQLKDDNVIAVIGDISSAATWELAAIAHYLEVVHLSPIATDEEIMIDHPWSFSPRTRLQHESEAIIAIIEEQLDCSGVIILYTDISGFLNRYQDFKERAIERGLSIFLDLEIDSQLEDFRPIIDKIQELPPTAPVVSFISSSHTIDLYQQMIIQNLPHPRISSAAVIDQEMVGYLGEAGEGVYSAIVSFHLLAEKEKKSSDFSANYIRLLGTGRVDNTALSIYESLWALLDVIEEVGVEPKKIREGLLAYQGKPLTGSISFDGFGLLEKNNHLVVQIEDGKLITR